MKSFILSLLAVIGFSICSFATWLPPGEIVANLPPANAKDANITEGEFKSIIKSIQDSYSSLAALHGGKLTISGDWKSETLNAGAQQMFGGWQIKITGGLARRPELTKDAFALILCHELGHHFGGFVFSPAQNPFEKPWASNEGQADYFATQVCARKIWIGEQDINAQFRETAGIMIKKQCDAAWSNTADQNLCYRILTAVESLTKTMAVLTNKPIPDFETPDASVVEQTSHSHPIAQCRMDTALQGAVCLAVFNDSFIPGKLAPGGMQGIEAEKEAADFSCTAHSGFSVGLRPTCWYKPRM